jgi:hypothetical protein
VKRPFNATEQEVIVLKAVWDLIDDMVNYTMFSKFAPTSDTELRFETSTHKRLFNIILADFLSKPNSQAFNLPTPPQRLPKSDQTYLFYLRRVCDSPTIGPTRGDCIRIPLDAFVQWLEADCSVEKVWLPSISLETDITVKRIQFIKICGNIAKHGFPRLNDSVKGICEILKNNGHTIGDGEGYLVIQEFYEWFHTDIFGYHSSAIAEFLNNIRWGIYDYLRPEFESSFTRDDPNSIAYRYIYPTACQSSLAQAMYSDLMNVVRREPYMPRFEVTRYLKMRY